MQQVKELIKKTNFLFCQLPAVNSQLFSSFVFPRTKIIAKFSLILLLLISLITFSSCDNKRVYEKYLPVKDQEWKLGDKKTFTVDIQDSTQAYNLYVNIRHTEEYPFSNLWLKLIMLDPGGKEQSQRMGFTLAEPSGRWLGTGLGDIFDDRFPVMRNIHLPKSGTYSFTLQHDMRMDDVPGLMDVGIRLEKAK